MSVLTLSKNQKERIWQGEYWGPNGVLFEVRSAYIAGEDNFASDVVMMSTEYSAANRALANLRTGSWRERIEAPLRLYDSFMRARKLALKAAPQVTINTVPDSIEVVTTLLVQLHCKQTARFVLDSLPWYDLAYRNYVAPHTRAFLIRNAIATDLTLLHGRRVGELEAIAKEVAMSGDYRQAVRVWRMVHQLAGELSRQSDELHQKLKEKMIELRRNIERCQELAKSADQTAKTRASL